MVDRRKVAAPRHRRRRLREAAEGALVVLALIAAVAASGGCAAVAPVAPPSHRVAVVVAHHDAELGVALGEAERAAVAAVGADPDVDDATAYVVAAGRPEVAVVDLEPRRPNGDIERGGRIDELLAERMAVLDTAIADAATGGTATDPLPALDAAGRTGAARIVLLTAGMGLTGPLDLTVAAWDRDPAELVDEAVTAGVVPDLTGRDVVIGGLGRTAGKQAPLGVAEQRWLRELWTALCAATGATCRIDDAVRRAVPPSSAVSGPIVPVPPPVVSRRGPADERIVEVPATLLFGPQSCAVPDPAAAAAALRPVLNLLGPGAVVHVSGRAAPVGPGDGVELSTCRAQRAVELLLAAGAPPAAIGVVRGDGDLLDPPGPADPQRLAGLRRVVFTVVTPQVHRER